MSSVLLNNYGTISDEMRIESGDMKFPIWLIVNPNYPDDITNIWNPIMYEIQDIVYRKLRARINSRNVFVLSAHSNIGKVSNKSSKEEAVNKIVALRESVKKHQPKFLITFGAITNEYVRRVFNQKTDAETGYWNTGNLGTEFEKALTNFDIDRSNCIPLARRITKSWNAKDWDEDNGYHYDVAIKIAERMIENKDHLKIWI